MGLIGWITAIPFVLLGLLVLLVVSCEGRKAYWDYKVRRMCDENGGVIVYENVPISYDEYMRLGGGTYGQFPIPDERHKEDSPYFYRIAMEENYNFDITIVKHTREIARSSDGKVLGKVVTYWRSGGDIPTGIAEGSSFSCRDVDGVELDIYRTIFAIEGNFKRT